MENKEQFKKMILSGEFSDLKKMSEKYSAEYMEGCMLEVAYEEQNITVYFFALYLLSEEETAERHAIASSLLAGPFCWMPGAYMISMKHMQRGVDLEPDDISYKLGMLLFYDIPEKLLPREIAVNYAKQILEKDPTNLSAKRILDQK